MMVLSKKKRHPKFWMALAFRSVFYPSVSSNQENVLNVGSKSVGIRRAAGAADTIYVVVAHVAQHGIADSGIAHFANNSLKTSLGTGRLLSDLLFNMTGCGSDIPGQLNMASITGDHFVARLGAIGRSIVGRLGSVATTGDGRCSSTGIRRCDGAAETLAIYVGMASGRFNGCVSVLISAIDTFLMCTVACFHTGGCLAFYRNIGMRSGSRNGYEILLFAAIDTCLISVVTSFLTGRFLGSHFSIRVTGMLTDLGVHIFTVFTFLGKNTVFCAGSCNVFHSGQLVAVGLKHGIIVVGFTAVFAHSMGSVAIYRTGSYQTGNRNIKVMTVGLQGLYVLHETALFTGLSHSTILFAGGFYTNLRVVAVLAANNAANSALAFFVSMSCKRQCLAVLEFSTCSAENVDCTLMDTVRFFTFNISSCRMGTLRFVCHGSEGNHAHDHKQCQQHRQ